MLDGVAPRLRDLRHRRGYTLAELAAETGISTSTLSRLESGLRRPTLELLIRIAAAYRANLDDLVGAPQIADPRIHPKPFYRDGKAIIPLTRQNPDVHAFKMVLPGHPPDQPVERKTHDGYDWVYVLSGRVRLALGDEEIILEQGEAAEFDTRGAARSRECVEGARRDPQPAERARRAGARAHRVRGVKLGASANHRHRERMADTKPAPPRAAMLVPFERSTP